MLGVFVLFLLLVVGAAIYLWNIPFPKAIAKPQATVVYDASGQPLATFSEQYRVNVPLNRVPPVVVNAVVSTEDRHFFSEGGVNPVSILRAGFADVTGRHLQGGSTITQQYVKQTYLTPKRTVTRKIEEAVLAMRLSQKDSKQEILQGYLNTIYWGRGAYGVEAASRVYFGKDVSALNLPEASLLAALIRDPETADPARSPATARRQQDDTLGAMVRDKKINRAQASTVEHLPFSSYVIPPPTTVSKAQATSMGDDYFLAAVRQELYKKYGRQTVDAGGLRVTTTFDAKLQQQAYNTLYGHNPLALNPAAGDPSAALVTLDGNGAVKALVGGQNYSASTVDLALGSAGGGSGRQAGSTFKAIMLAEVIKEGYSVQSFFPAPPKVVVPNGDANGPWTVTNYAGEAVSPRMDLVDATADSVNTVYAQIVARIGAKKLDTMAEALGIDPSELPGAYDSQVLGSADVSPLEMAGAYATFANGGMYHRPLLVTRVTDPKGHQLPLPVTPETRQVLTPEQAAVETSVLQQVVQRGTGVAAGNLQSPVAGKTGTTQNAGDAWFIGYTPKITTALWMGYASSDKSMDGFRGQRMVQGGGLPAQLWHAYMAALLTLDPDAGGPFPPPPGAYGIILQPLPLNGDTVVLGSAPVAVPAPTAVTAPPSTVPPPSTTAPVPTTVRPTATTSPDAPTTTPPPPTPTTAPPAPTTTSAPPSTTVPPSPTTVAPSGSG